MPKLVSKPDYIIPNQVFIGCPWKTIRTKYQRAINELKKKYPLSYVLIGRDEDQDADDLLTIIKNKLMSSSQAIFDATGGNANVSLEFGFAEALDIPRTLYMSSHILSHRTVKESPIIADLAGKRRVQYTQQKLLQSRLSTLSLNHSYTKRFENFLRKQSKRLTRGAKKRTRSLALKIIHCLDEKDIIRREDIVLSLLADQAAYKRCEIDQMIRSLHSADLINSVKGRYSTVSMI